MLKELKYTHKKICEEKYQYLKVQLLSEERNDRYKRMLKYLKKMLKKQKKKKDCSRKREKNYLITTQNLEDFTTHN